MSSTATRLTGAGVGAIAVLRLAGPRVGVFLAEHFTGKPAPSRCAYGKLLRDGEVLDDVVVVLAPDGSWADVNLHGGTWLVESFLELARSKGFEVASEVVTDAESTLEAEVLSHLPLALTEQSLAVLLAQEANWRSAVERGLSPAEIERILADRSLHWLLRPPRIAIVGAPNVGKSTLANQLFAQEHSITADLPGTTRDWVQHIANIGGLAVSLMDTPGLRDSGDAIERQAIDLSMRQVEQADLCIVVLEAGRPATAEEEQLQRGLAEPLVVVNKCDKGEPPAGGAVHSIATTGQGLDDLRLAIRQRFGCEDLDPTRSRLWTDRQRAILTIARSDPAALRRILQ